MAREDVVSGYIRMRTLEALAFNLHAIQNYPFDEIFPFTNIFWGGSPAQYSFPLIGFTGSYKGVRDHWSEWLWKFSDLLSKLDAFSAIVRLDGMFGELTWELEPKIKVERLNEWIKLDTNAGQEWVIISAPADDFSIDPEFLTSVENDIWVRDPTTGQRTGYRWDKVVERMLPPGN